MATWNSRGLRGSTLEDLINRTIEKYQENNLALIQKIPTPITPIKIDPEHRHSTYTICRSLYLWSSLEIRPQEQKVFLVWQNSPKEKNTHVSTCSGCSKGTRSLELQGNGEKKIKRSFKGKDEKNFQLKKYRNSVHVNYFSNFFNYVNMKQWGCSHTDYICFI